MKKLRVILVMVLALCLLGLCACDITDTTDNTSGNNNPGNTPTENGSGVQEQVLLDDEKVKVTFIKIFEEPSLPNNCFLQLKVENKSDKTVMVSLKDSYVNDTAQTMGTGVPIVLAPGKNSQQSFFFGYGNIGITSKSEIKKIEFKVWLMDNDTYDTVVETQPLVVDFTK